MDLFRATQNKICGVGGMECPCCNNMARKGLKKDHSFSGIVRQKLKTKLRKEIEDELDSASPNSIHIV